MSHDLEYKQGVWSFVYSPQEGAGWHGLGGECPDDATPAIWRGKAGHDFTASKRQIYFTGTCGPGANNGLVAFPDRFAMVRDDTEHALGVVSDVYKVVQPSEIDDLCDQFASYDSRLGRSSAFTLRQGDLICSTYAYRDDVTIAGDKHKAFLMASTSFDGSSASLFWISLTRAVCQNTIHASLADSGAIVRVRHNSKLNAATVQQQLATLAASIDAYKALGDSLARTTMTVEQVSAFFKATLDIDPLAKAEDITARKMNQFSALSKALSTTAHGERGIAQDGPLDAFTAMQAVTRYVDHTRSARLGDTGNETVARFDSAQFGSGATMKAKAMALLVPLIKDRIAA